MKIIKRLSFLTLVIVAIAACNKTKKFSKRLAGETWTVTELTVDGTSAEELPKLIFSDCDIYEKEPCVGELENHEGGHANFIWQIRDKGKVFELSNQSSLDDAHSHGGDEHATEEAVLLSQNLSGIYTITKSKRKSMEMESTATLGFEGKKVILKLELK